MPPQRHYWAPKELLTWCHQPLGLLLARWWLCRGPTCGSGATLGARGQCGDLSGVVDVAPTPQTGAEEGVWGWGCLCPDPAAEGGEAGAAAAPQERADRRPEPAAPASPEPPVTEGAIPVPPSYIQFPGWTLKDKKNRRPTQMQKQGPPVHLADPPGPAPECGWQRGDTSWGRLVALVETGM